MCHHLAGWRLGNREGQKKQGGCLHICLQPGRHKAFIRKTSTTIYISDHYQGPLFWRIKQETVSSVNSGGSVNGSQEHTAYYFHFIAGFKTVTWTSQHIVRRLADCGEILAKWISKTCEGARIKSRPYNLKPSVPPSPPGRDLGEPKGSAVSSAVHSAVTVSWKEGERVGFIGHYLPLALVSL